MHLVLEQPLGRHTYATRADDGTQAIARLIPQERCTLFEALRAADLSFVPKILQVSEFGPSTALVVEQCVQGLPLHTFRDALARDQRRCSHLLGLLAQQLERLHRSGIWHLDLKPGNILVSLSEDRVYFIDFEFAQPARHNGVQASLGYTPLYASWEQVEAGVATPTTDVRALGLTMCELWLGHHPLERLISHTDDFDLARSAARTEVTFEEDSQLGALLTSMTRIDATDRIQISELAQLLPGRPAPADMRRAMAS